MPYHPTNPIDHLVALLVLNGHQLNTTNIVNLTQRIPALKDSDLTKIIGMIEFSFALRYIAPAIDHLLCIGNPSLPGWHSLSELCQVAHLHATLHDLSQCKESLASTYIKELSAIANDRRLKDTLSSMRLKS